jgi:hypothetical protein
MTPSSKSEPAKTGPDETIDLTSEPTSEPVAEATPEPEPEPEPEPAAEPAGEPAAETEPVTVAAPVVESTTDETTAIDAEAADDAQPDSAPAATIPLAASETFTPPTAFAKDAAVVEQPVAASSDPQDTHATDSADEADTDEDEDDYEEILGSEPSDRFPTLIPLIGSLFGLTAIAALILVAFALPAVKSEPNKLPIGVSGTAEFQSQVRTALTKEGLAPFKVTGYNEERQLREAILDRKVYGGLALGDSSLTMLVSSGGSPVAAQTLSSLANSLVQGGIQVTDLTTLPKSDPRGDGLAAANLPLVIAAILPALILIPLYRRRTAAQLGVTVGASVLIGLGLSAVLSLALGSTEDSNFLLVSAGLAGGVLATSVLLLGLFAVAGRVGAGVGAALLVLFAAPLSGLSTAPEWLPSPWGTIGQLLPPGANATLLRSTAYFDGSGGFRPVLVLGLWTLIGLLLVGLGLLLKSRRSQQPVGQESGINELLLDEPATA